MKKAEKRRLLEEHYLDFFSLAMAILHDEQDARDAVQEALVKVLCSVGVRRHILSYTLKTVRNCAIDIIRYKQRFVPLRFDLPDVESRHEERLRTVGRLRDELPEATRSLIELYDEEGYTLQELAAMTGVSMSTLRRRIEDIHKTLKQKIIEEDI